MQRIAILCRPIVSVMNEAIKMKKTFEKYGCQADIIDYTRLQPVYRIPRYDKAIFWAPYTGGEISHLYRFWNPRFTARMVSYYVIEGISATVGFHLPFLKMQYIVTPSNFSKECIELTGVKVKEVIPHQADEKLDVDDAFGIAWRNKYPKDKKLIVYIGNPIKRKGLIELRQAVNILSRRRNDFHVVIHTANEPALQGYNINILRHQNITLELEFGKIPKRQALAKMKYADIYVQPSKGEGFGLPVLEALQLGKPLVCINAPGVNEIANHENSFMVEPYEFVTVNYYPSIMFREVNYRPEDLADKIEEALDAPKDVIEEKKQKGFETVERFRNTYKRFVEI